MNGSRDPRPALVTGGAGFIGSNIADRLASEGHRVIVYDSLFRPGVEANLEWLQRRHGGKIDAVIADVRDACKVAETASRAKVVFHLAAQVAVTTSLLDPRDDAAINIQGTLNVLEAARRAAIPVIFASTNKVYGDLGDLSFEAEGDRWVPADPSVRAYGIGENRPLDFHTPYGCSKGAADQYVLDYARSYGVASAVLRMSCIYGRRQLGNEDQGWVAHFLIRALEGEPITVYGDGRQVRDVLNIADAVEAYVRLWANIDELRGRAFNLGGGPANALSLLQLISFIREQLERDVAVNFDCRRPGDQRYFVADTRALERALRLGTKVDWRSGVRDLALWLSRNRRSAAPIGADRAAVGLPA